MGLFGNIRQAMANARAGAPGEDVLATLTPEQRARYEANMAEVERGRAEGKAAYEQARQISDEARVLDGPAGRYLYGRQLGDGTHPDEIERLATEEGNWAAIRQVRADNKGELKRAVRQSFNLDEIPQESDPDRRRQIRAEERAARDAARGPYRAPNAAPIAFTRVATRGRTQLDELRQHLVTTGLAARPDLVFGCYRVPDRISGALTPHSEQGRVVEWDIVHWSSPAGTDLGPAGPVEVTVFPAHSRWVARRVGEASILDEDLGVAFSHRAGLGPERCFGVARTSEIRWRQGGGEDDDLRALVRGLAVVHAGDPTGVHAAMEAEAPLALPVTETAGVHTEVIDFASIARCVHPKIHHPPACPSPFPYLPSTPDELLQAYLEVVGVQPSDCFGAQATFDHPSRLIQGGLLTTNVGPKQPCADGQDRMRTRACEVVVVTYRDSPAYAEGRQRWSAYQRGVLQAHLDRGVRVRPTVEVRDDSDLPAPIRALATVDRTLDVIFSLGAEQIPPYRYCWPPIDRRPY